LNLQCVASSARRTTPSNRSDSREAEQVEDRRRAHDSMAYDRSPQGEFARWFPHAAKIERY
jgi:hypothetical protein